MATEPLNSTTPASTVPVALPAEENKGRVLAELSTEELLQPQCQVSKRLGRAFLGAGQYESEKALGTALEEALKALPEVPSAYKPTGETTVAATLLMLLVSPVVLLALAAVCGGICLGWAYLEGLASPEPLSSTSRLLGIASLAVNLGLVVLMVVIPSFCFGALSKWFKNRNPVLPAVLAGLIELVVAVGLFFPIWKGETLAPTHLTFVFIPIRWVLIAIGGLLVPLVGALAVHAKVASQKFCEQSGCCLRRMRRVKLAFDWAENALALLQRREYIRAVRVPKAELAEVEQKHWAELSLWWAPQAATAFLELEMRFHGKTQPKVLGSGQVKDKTKEWLAFSVQLDQLQAGALAQEVAPEA